MSELLRSSDSKRKLSHYPFNKHYQRFLQSKQNATAQASAVFFQNVNIPSCKGIKTIKAEVSTRHFTVG